MSEELQSKFDEFDKPEIIRRSLLPWWIKTFCWIFMILAVCGLGTLIGNAFTPNVHLSLYGFETNTSYSVTGIFIISIMVLKGFASYSLWFEKPNAISIAKFDAIIGFVICVASMFVIPFTHGNGHIELRLELLLLIPYYLKINKIEYEWDNLEKP
ncbi:hypothetical protein EYY60_16080 [Flavobacterium zhairuonense]|uniref:hypothetical protein n=1 Tax=Flavobacterium zhairuonense TaxID=2493631 RepID=UPI001043C692|nr:hypothetical protein [Flavobacterium zhairuonense]KAF2508645.1 hypothetical protein EYY60_16080 [Flavobacterium zhairuonense]